MGSTASGRHLYAPGVATAICGSGIAVLVGLPAADPLVSRVFACLEGTPGLEDVLEVLVSPGLRTVRHFAAAEVAEHGTRVVVRGEFVGQVLGDGADVVGAGLWVDRFIDAPATVVLRTAEASPQPGQGLPIGIGVVAADWIGAAGADVAVVPAPEADAISVEPFATPVEPLGEAVPDAREVGELEPPAPSVAAVVEVEPPAEHSASDKAGETQVPPFESFGWAAAPESDVPAARRAAGEPAEPSEAPEPPAVARQAATREDLVNVFPASAGSGQPEFHAPASEPKEQASGGFIDAFPWGDDAGFGAPTTPPAPAPSTGWPPAAPAPAPSPSGAQAQAAPARAAFGSHTDPEAAEMTVDRRQLVGTVGPTVVAARCPAGHLSPAYAGVCRVCRQPLPPQQPFEIARPPLGVLRLSTGDTVTLDRSVIMGRNPRLPSGYKGEQPNLVKLNDPGKDVSSQHLEVSLDYWHVSVKDLGSTNGTEVILPGEAPQQLRANDPMTIEPGTRVILAGVIEFVFEVTG